MSVGTEVYLMRYDLAYSLDRVMHKIMDLLKRFKNIENKYVYIGIYDFFVNISQSFEQVHYFVHYLVTRTLRDHTPGPTDTWKTIIIVSHHNTVTKTN